MSDILPQFLMATGARLCIALGILHPTPDACETAFRRLTLPADQFGGAVSLHVSCPDNVDDAEFCSPKEFTCIELMKYKIYDGTYGTQRFCYRSGRATFNPQSGVWQWGEYKP